MDLADLAALAARHIPSQTGTSMQYVTPAPHLGILRQHAPQAFEAAIYEPVLITVLEGRKQTILGTDAYPMGAGECLLVSHDLPVVARVTKAPYLALLVSVQLDLLRELYTELALVEEQGHALSVQRCDAQLIDALGRYLALSPRDLPVLGPLIVREIHYRLATASFGAMLRSLIRRDSHASTIARAIAQLRRTFRSPISVPELARSVGMSPSAFHKHFKAITASSPLQFQKHLRLLEARRLLRMGATSVATTAFDVGYESATQFSREYTRKFGTPPSADQQHDLRRR
ncbi:MAG TPA: AraC family transcriptional regulator [Kofleriaceae bacterium]